MVSQYIIGGLGRGQEKVDRGLLVPTVMSHTLQRTPIVFEPSSVCELVGHWLPGPTWQAGFYYVKALMVDINLPSPHSPIECSRGNIFEVEELGRFSP